MSENRSAPDVLTESEVAADEAAHIADPIRYELDRRDRGAAARRLAEGLALRFSTSTPTTDDLGGAA